MGPSNFLVSAGEIPTKDGAFNRPTRYLVVSDLDMGSAEKCGLL